MTFEVILTHEEINRTIPYAVICEARYGSRWDTMHRKRRWKEEFTDAERNAARKLFSKAHLWTLVKGAPEELHMKASTYLLWQKLGDFCASL